MWGLGKSGKRARHELPGIFAKRLARATSRLGFTPYSRDLLNTVDETRISQRLALIQRLTDIPGSIIIQRWPKQRAIGLSAGGLVSRQLQIDLMRRKQ